MFSSFELLAMKSMQPIQSLSIATVYRPPRSYKAFLTEFPEFLSDFVVMADNIKIFGDFNFHMEKSTDPLQKAFGTIIDSVGFVQHVSRPTHCHSHTLDLVLSRGIDVVDLNVFLIILDCWTTILESAQTPTKDHQKLCYTFSDNTKIPRCPSRILLPTQGRQSTKIS
jgi:hypothetical protein